VDVQASLEAQARRLEAACEVAPGSALLEKELRATLLALAAPVRATMSSRSSTPSSPAPRWATPATEGRDHFAGKVDVVAAALGFGGPGLRGLMPHQRQIIATGTEIDPVTGCPLTARW
jgi:hypothetical protein